MLKKIIRSKLLNSLIPLILTLVLTCNGFCQSLDISDRFSSKENLLSPSISIGNLDLIGVFNDYQSAVPASTIERLTDIFGCPRDVIASIAESIVDFLNDKKDLSQLEYEIASRTTSRKQPVSPYICMSNEAGSVSITTQSNAIVRFFLQSGQLVFQELGDKNRGLINYPNQQNLQSLVKHFKGKVNYFLRPEGITLEDLDQLFWAAPKDYLFKDQNGAVRPLYNDEIYYIISSLNTVLTQNGFQPKLSFDHVDKFMHDFSVMGSDEGMSARVKIDKRVSEHVTLFDALSIADDEYVAFLARDAISAHEFLHYGQMLQGDAAKRSGLICQPGLPQHMRISSHVEDKNLAYLQNIVTEIFNTTKDDLGIERIGVLKEFPDSPAADAELYAKFVKVFRQKMINAIENDDIVRQEARFVYAQFKNNGSLAYNKVRIVDLNASGKTILYVKSVLEYFSRLDGLDIQVNEFVGNGRGHRIGMPRIKHFFQNTQVEFSDIMWPFYTSNRDYKTGTVKFELMKSQHLFALHIYQSLRLLNEAIDYYGRFTEQEFAMEDNKLDHNVESARSILSMTRDEFTKLYEQNGFVRPGFFGNDRIPVEQQLDQWFGKNNWHVYYLINGKLSNSEQALSFFENAYVEFFKNNPDELEWLSHNAKDVYDNALSNINSGMDYTIQETVDHHYQDIAIRRAFKRLGVTFKGDRYIQIRGPRSEGYRFNPGYVPFHKQELIVKPTLSGWWKPNSIEAFYQSCKVIILEPQVKDAEQARSAWRVSSAIDESI